MPDHRQINFVESLRPALSAGLYNITVTQHVNVNGQVEDFQTSKSFAVQGERFRIPSKEIHAVFPPPNGKGEYLNCLPHVIFNRANLPWLRGLNSNLAAPTWLAVLLCDAHEAPHPQSKQVVDLIPVGTRIQVPDDPNTYQGTMPSGYVSYPFAAGQNGARLLDYGESANDGVVVVDFPADLFNRIAPTEGDMAYLAHVREVHTAGMAEGVIRGGRSLKGFLKDGVEDPEPDLGTFAVVVGNRIPDSSASTAFLVSLEDLGNQLPSVETSGLAGGIEYVRLACLYSWTFTATSGASSFVSHFNALNKDEGHGTTITPRIPCQLPSSSEVQAALAAQTLGHLSAVQADVLVRNAFGMGYTAMPHQTRSGDQTVSWYRGPFRPDPPTHSLVVPLPWADASTNYNPKTGLLDVSYGAAWQLGQLLALKNKGFSMALFEWRQSLEQANHVQTESAWVADHLASLESARVESELAHHSAFLNLFQHLFAHENLNPLDPPTAVLSWIQDLSVLKGIPFNYLIPDPQMLPPESLRFFYLDHDWILALVDGALSLGRKSVEDPIANIILRNLNLNTSGVSGYILRSKTVVGWPGLKVKAFSSRLNDNQIINSTQITATHHMRIGDDLEVAFFNDVIKTLVFQEPRESLHFGVELGPILKLRHLTAEDNSQPGQETGNSINVSTREGGRTLNIQNIAASIARALPNAPTITSAEFAIEMVKAASGVVFRMP